MLDKNVVKGVLCMFHVLFKRGKELNAVMCEIITLNMNRSDEEDPNKGQTLFVFYKNWWRKSPLQQIMSAVLNVFQSS